MEHTVEITGLAHGGDGITRIDGQVCFVALALPGDTVRLKIVKQARQVLWAEIVEVLTPSPDRLAAPPCPQFGRCGVCPWCHFAYPAQGEWKRRLVQDAFRRIGGCEVEVEWVEEAAWRLGYRTRAEFHGERGKLGFYERASHDVVDPGCCPLCHPRINDALGELRRMNLRGPVTVTVNPEGDETMVWSKGGADRVRKVFPLAGAPQDRGAPAQFLFDGRPIVNGAFSQGSLLLNRRLIEVARTAIGAPATLLDLYCGNGNFSLDHVANSDVTGIDHQPEAVEAARVISGADYRTGAEEDMQAAIGDRAWDTILLDPPRTGAKALMPALAQALAPRIVYVSCDAPTLARDVRVLAGAGWGVARVTAVDMFPQTPHVETVCTLERH